MASVPVQHRRRGQRSEKIDGSHGGHVSGTRFARVQAGFGVPTMIAVHSENDPTGEAWRSPRLRGATGGMRRRVESRLVAEVKSDLRASIPSLCGMLQTAHPEIRRMVAEGIEPASERSSIRLGDHHRGAQAGRHHLMMDQSQKPERQAFELAEEPRTLMRPLYAKHRRT